MPMTPKVRIGLHHSQWMGQLMMQEQSVFSQHQVQRMEINTTSVGMMIPQADRKAINKNNVVSIRLSEMNRINSWIINST